eukprot:scaffold137890_cov99-Phaeocystis_antarctica.AAC.2
MGEFRRHTFRERHEKVVLVELEGWPVARLSRGGAAARDHHVGIPHRPLRRVDIVALLHDERHAARLQPRTHRDGIRADHAPRATHRVVVACGPVVLVDGVGGAAGGAEERHRQARCEG